MCGFLHRGRCVSPLWLSPEPFDGQAQGNAAERKRQLRPILLELRRKLKQEALADQQTWGRRQMDQLVLFLRQTGLLGTPRLPNRMPTIASYWPMNAELELLPESGTTDPQVSSQSVPTSTTLTAQWILPHIKENKTLLWSIFSSEVHHWPKDKYGLPVPPASENLQPFGVLSPTPWIVITPCLAVDQKGIRLGYGGGYYDRFLAAHGDQCLTIACVPSALFWNCDELPSEVHDTPVDVVVTEKNWTIINPTATQQKISLLFKD